MKGMFAFALVAVGVSCSPAAKRIPDADREEVGGHEGLVTSSEGTSTSAAEFKKAGDYLDERRYTEAMAIYTEPSTASDQPAQAWVGIGACYMMQQENEKAREAYERSLALAPGLYGALLGLGSACSRLGWYDRAIASYRAAAAAKPDMADVYWGLAVVFDRMDMGDSAVANAERFIRMEPRSTYVPDLRTIIGRYRK